MESTRTDRTPDDHYRLTSSLVWEAFEQAPAFIAVLRGPSHVFEYTNRAYLQLVGFRDLPGFPVREALPEVEGQGFFELLDGVYRSGEPFVGTELPVVLQRAPDGPPEERFVDFVYQPLSGPDGAVFGILAQGTDVTARVRAEAAVREREERYQALFESIDEGFFLCEVLRDDAGRAVDYRFLDANLAFGVLTGVPPDAAAGRTLREAFPGIEDIWVEHVGQAADSGETAAFEDFVAPLGRWYAARAYPQGGDRVAVFFTDVTMRKHAEAALRESESRYRTLFETIDEGYCLCEMVTDDAGVPVDYRFLEVNPAFADMTGITAEAVGHTARELVPRLEDHWIEMYAGVGLGRESTRFEEDSEAMGRSFDVYASPVGSPESGRFAIVFTDVTVRRRAEQEIRDLNATLEHRVAERTAEVRHLAAQLTVAEQTERERMAEVLHDDLQQHLVGLSMTLSLLRRETASERAEALGERASQTLGGAIQLARTLATELAPAVLHAERVRDLLDGVAVTKRERYGLDVSVSVEGDPDVPDRALRVLLYRAICEVLLNVVKHAGATQARLVAWEDGAGTYVRIEDDGAGFDVGAAATGPAGFGLTSVRERLGLVGGRFEVDSVPGIGTRVTVGVPSKLERAGTGEAPRAVTGNP